VKTLRALNVSRNTVLAARVRAASTLYSRAIGLLGTAHLPEQEGLWISPCRGVHTMFMRYPIDVLFLDRDGLLLHMASLPPFRVSRCVRKSVGVLELAGGVLRASGTRPGDCIQLQSVEEG
jgi:hypothetical protein